MSSKVIVMKKIREILRLKLEAKLSNRQIARAVGTSASSISYYTRAAHSINLTWPLGPEVNDQALETLLEPHCQQFKHTKKNKQEPDFAYVKQELSKKHMTLQLLWQEYRSQYPNCYSYANYCRMYKSWCKKNKLSMRHEYCAGEKCFIDYAGDTIPIWDKRSQAISHNAQVFIAVLGYSNYCFIDVSLSQQKQDWLASNVKALEFFQGVPAILIPDNLRSAVTDSCRYDPVINPSYADFAQHYGTVILPARPYSPRDKATVENSVLIVERWIMARLRKHRFYSLGALLTKIRELNTCLNEKAFQKKEGSRHSQFVTHEKAQLRPLPTQKYQFAQFKNCLVQSNYHISLHNNQYSVPHYLVGKQVECKYTSDLLEIFYQHDRVASHIMNHNRGETKTNSEHMPEFHKAYKSWNVDVFLAWAKSKSAGIYNVALIVNEQKQHPVQIQRFHMGLRQLLQQYGVDRLHHACCRAIALNAISFQSLSSILKKGLDSQPLIAQIPSTLNDVKHEHIRGAGYYDGK